MKKAVMAIMIGLLTAANAPAKEGVAPPIEETVEPVYLCPDGFKWDANLKACTRPPDCPAGGTYNPETKRCEMPLVMQCPEGFTYNKESGNCEMPLPH